MSNVTVIQEPSRTETGDGIIAKNARWTFGGDVAENFDAHVEKSVPLYGIGHDLILALSDYFIKADSLCYELGTSTGSLASKLAQRHADLQDARFVGLDVERSMIAHAQSKHAGWKNLEFRNTRVEDFDFERADLVVSYYTMQFVHPKKRQQVFDAIYKALEWGGALIMFEKVRASDARFQDIVTTLYEQYKLERGYSAEQIVAKRMSLKGVMEPFSSRANNDLLTRAGFVDIITVQKYLCFEGILAIK